ncbi:hypothetical protein ACFGZ3_03440 [Pasteurella multocida]
MGFGGILAAMAQGLGTGMVKVADEGWKKAADERKFKFYADENEKGRAHDFALNDRKFEHEKQMEDIKTRNAISLEAHKARIGAKSSTSPEKKFINEFGSILETFNQNEERIGKIDELLSNPKDLSTDQIDKLKQQRSVLVGQNDRIANDDRIRNEVMSGKYGERMISSYNIVVEPFRKLPEVAQTKPILPEVKAPTTMVATSGPYSPRVPRTPKNMDVSFGKLINNIGEDIKKTKPRHPMGLGFIPTQNE